MGRQQTLPPFSSARWLVRKEKRLGRCQHQGLFLPARKTPFTDLDLCTQLTDTLTQNRWEFSALLEDSLAGLLTLAGLVGCCSLSATQQSLQPQDEPKVPPAPHPQTRKGLLQLLPAGLVARVARQRGRAGGGRGRARRHGSQGGGGSGVLCLLQLPGSVELLADAGL